MGQLRRFSRGTLQIVLIVIALLIGLRVALPYIVKEYVNKKLDEMPEYDGRIADVDMHLWEGAYSIQGIEVVKTEGDIPVPFFSSRRVTFSVEWKALFDGALVGEIDFYELILTKPNLIRWSCVRLESLGHVVQRETVLSSGLRGDAVGWDRYLELTHVSIICRIKDADVRGKPNKNQTIDFQPLQEDLERGGKETRVHRF
jgi:hypothetical protein